MPPSLTQPNERDGPDRFIRLIPTMISIVEERKTDRFSRIIKIPAEKMRNGRDVDNNYLIRF